MVVSSTVTTTPQSSLRFVRNHASYGGGMCSGNSSIALQGTVFLWDNRAAVWGGGAILQYTSCASEGLVNFTGKRVRVHFS